MGKRESINLIREILEKTIGENTEEKVYNLIKLGLNETRLRNCLIIMDFDRMMEKGVPTMRAYTDIGIKYHTCSENIRAIIRQRSFNEI